jgi:hypothetical protein
MTSALPGPMVETAFPIPCPEGASHTSPGCNPGNPPGKTTPRSEGTPHRSPLRTFCWRGNPRFTRSRGARGENPIFLPPRSPRLRVRKNPSLASRPQEASDLIPCGASSRRGGLPFLIPVFTRNPTSRLQFAIRLALSGFSALLRFIHGQVSTLPCFSRSSTPSGQGRGPISPHERQGKGANTRIRWLVHHRLEASQTLPSPFPPRGQSPKLK